MKLKSWLILASWMMGIAAVIIPLTALTGLIAGQEWEALSSRFWIGLFFGCSSFVLYLLHLKTPDY